MDKKTEKKIEREVKKEVEKELWESSLDYLREFFVVRERSCWGDSPFP